MVEGAYTSFQDTLTTTIPRLTGLPAFPFGVIILSMVEWRHDLDMDDLAPIHAVGRISPRPILILVGGADTVVDPQCGEQLYQAAGEPRELWIEPELGHGTFARDKPQALESRMETFFGHYLLGVPVK